MATPNLTDYSTFVYTVMAVPTAALPTNSPWLPWSLSQAELFVDPALQNAATPYFAPVQINAYVDACYNLAGDLLINYAPDQAGQTFFSDARTKFSINTATTGVVSSTSDESTSVSLAIPPAVSNLLLSQLQNTKTPWGRVYLSYAQSSGSLWGVS